MNQKAKEAIVFAKEFEAQKLVAVKHEKKTEAEKKVEEDLRKREHAEKEKGKQKEEARKKAEAALAEEQSARKSLEKELEMLRGELKRRDS